MAAPAGRYQLSEATTLVSLCRCMVLVPSPHILNGAIDLARTRMALGPARFAYAAVIVLLICAGILLGFAAVGLGLAIANSARPVPLAIDMIAAGCAVASFGTFFSMPWRLLAFLIAVGMLAPPCGWTLISAAGTSPATAALISCMLVGVIDSPALGFSAVVSMMPAFFSVQRRGGACPIGVARAERAADPAGRHRGERRHGVSNRLGHDRRTDSPAHAVRALVRALAIAVTRRPRDRDLVPTPARLLSCL